MKKILVLTLLCAYAAHAEKYTLEQLINKSEVNSPLLKINQSKVSYAEAAHALANSYYFPVFNFTQRYTESTNPVQAFGMKLMREDFSMQDFQIDKLNNPDRTKAHQSSFTVFMPIDIAGIIGIQKKIIEDQKGAAQFEGQWIQKEIKKNLTSLYHAYFSMDDLQRFFSSEKEFLSKIVKLYDSKSEDNKNRYLSYNQARIILDSLSEGIETLDKEKVKILKELGYLAGLENVELERKDIATLGLKDFSIKGEERFDLESLKKYLSSVEAEISKEKRTYVPELSLFGQYNLTSEKFNHSGKDTTVGAQLSWTFGLSNIERVSLAQAKKTTVAYQYEDKSRRAKTDMAVQMDDLEKIQVSLRHMENRHQIFSENKKILSFQYGRGSVELYNLLDNFISYVQNYSDLMKLKAEYQAKLAGYAQNFKE